MSERSTLPLAGLKVLELGEFIAAAYCARQLAMLGAEVWKVETPPGDVSRRLGPFRDDRPDPEESGLFITLNIEKRGLTLNPAHPDARSVIAALVREADVVVENVGQRRLREIGWDFERMAAANDRIVVASITPFGLTGRRADHVGTHLTIFHAGGEGFTLPGGMGWLLYSDREPIQGPSNIGHYDSGSAAAAAILSAMMARTLGQDPGAELLDISEQEAQLGVNRIEMNRFPSSGFVESRATRALPVGETLQCRDGYVQIEPLEWRMWHGVCEAMGRPELATDERFKDQASLFRNGAAATQYLAEWAIQYDKNFVYHTVQAHACVAGIVRSPQDLIESPHFHEHGFFARVEDRDYVVPVGAHRFSTDQAWAVDDVTVRPAPALGADNARVYGQVMGWTEDDLVRNRETGVI